MTYTQSQAIEILYGAVDRLNTEALRIQAEGLSEQSFARVQFTILTLELRLNELRKLEQHERDQRKAELVRRFNDRQRGHGEAAAGLAARTYADHVS